MADMTKEMPYEQVNAISVITFEHIYDNSLLLIVTFIKNHMVQYGEARLIKGAYQMRPDIPSLKLALERIRSLAAEEHSPMVNIEYFPLRKILSVPNGTCAFIRSGACNVNSLTTWKNNTPENLAKARSLARELTGIIAAGQKAHFTVNRGYGNYGKWLPL